MTTNPGRNSEQAHAIIALLSGIQNAAAREQAAGVLLDEVVRLYVAEGVKPPAWLTQLRDA